MTKQYAILNPADGSYIRALTEQERNTLVAEKAIAFYLSHCASEPFSIIETNENGDETWRTPSGEERMTPEQLQAAAEAEAAQWAAEQQVQP